MAALFPILLGGCTERAPLGSDFVPDYLGASVSFLSADLVQVRARMTKAQTAGDAAEYADCALAAQMQDRDLRFARVLRTKFTLEGGVSSVDAVYTISPSLPRGIKVIDAKSVNADCAQKRIPTV